MANLRVGAVLITFFKLLDYGLEPQLSDPAALGGVPTSGFRFCEPLRQANSFGWYLFLPMELHLRWDGYEIDLSVDSGESWFRLVDAVQYPNFSSEFDSECPDGSKGYAPPFVKRTNDPDIIQIWTGHFLKTKEGVVCNIRPPVNIESPRSYRLIEGIVATDWWYGPLFVNLKLYNPGDVVILRPDRPLVQVQPIQSDFRKLATTAALDIREGLQALTEENWSDYADSVVSKMKDAVSYGDYAKRERRRKSKRD